MNVSLLATLVVAATSLSLHAAATESPASAPAASAATPAPQFPPRCVAPGADPAANRACAAGLLRHAESEGAAGRNDAALAALTRADAFAPDDLRFTIAAAGLKLRRANQLSPAGIDAAAKAAPGDVGLAMMHAELSLAKKDFVGALADLDRVVAQRPEAAAAWELRAAVNVARPDFDAARADVGRALRLDPKSATALRLRGVLRNHDGDNAGALADYQAARALAPRPDDPFVIGSTEFLLHRFEAAADTLARRPPAAPEGTYWRLWRYLAVARVTGIERARGALGPGTPPGPGVPWPGPVVDYYLGTIDAKRLLSDAQRSQEAVDLSQVCEAHFYMAEDALLRQRADAIPLFRQALKECPINFHEYEGAAAELRAAGVTTPVSAPALPASAASAAR
jgi:tetratricopeptide (TPR) repeat protein